MLSAHRLQDGVRHLDLATNSFDDYQPLHPDALGACLTLAVNLAVKQPFSTGP